MKEQGGSTHYYCKRPIMFKTGDRVRITESYLAYMAERFNYKPVKNKYTVAHYHPAHPHMVWVELDDGCCIGQDLVHESGLEPLPAPRTE